ncbi:MAG: type II secretion system protein GspN [Bdellovibrionales bacterium]
MWKDRLKFSTKVFFVAILPSFLVFSVLFFPFSDLGSLVTTKVAEATGNQVYLSFEEMGLHAIPAPGLDFDKVTVDVPGAPSLKMSSLSLSPSIAGLLSFKPGVNVETEGLFGGSLNLNTKGMNKTDKGVRRQRLDLEIESIRLSTILQELGSPLNLNARMNMDADVTLDPSFDEQPEGELKLDLKPLSLLGGSIDTGVMGAIDIPPIELGEGKLDANLEDGDIRISEAVFGSKSSEVEIKLKGRIGMKIRNTGRGTKPQFGSYNLDVEINTTKGFEDKFGIMLSFINKYKTPTNTGNSFRFKASSSSFSRPVKMEAL